MKILLVLVVLLSLNVNAQSSSSSRLVIIGGTSTASKSSVKSQSSVRSSAIASSSSSSVIDISDEKQNIALAWTPPTQREDGKPLLVMDAKDKPMLFLQPDGTYKTKVDLVNYEIRYRRSGTEEWTGSVFVTPSAKNYKLKGLPVGKYDVEIAAVSRSGLYSVFVNAMGIGPEPVTSLRTAFEIIKPTLKVGD